MTEISLPITTLLGSCLLALLLVLSWHVIKGRQSGGVSIGDGDDKSLERRIRAQANLTEYAPLFVILIALLEMQGGNPLILGLLSAAFVIGRLGHGYALAFTTGNVAGRLGGMVLTLGSSGLAVIYGIVVAIS